MKELQFLQKIPEFRVNLFRSAGVYTVHAIRLTFSGGGVKIEGRACSKTRFAPGSLIILTFVRCFALSTRTPCMERVCHGCHEEVHYRLVCQRLRSQRLRSHGARTVCSRPRDPFGGYPGLSVPSPLLAQPWIMARSTLLSGVFLAGGERSGAVASETAGRTTFVGAPE
jgi:hypothetical protein